MYVEHDRKHGCGYAVYTDTNGCARVTGKCGEVLSVVVRKDGYYKTSFDVKYPLENVSSPIVNGKWQPYPFEDSVVLKLIRTPIPLVSRHGIYKQKWLHSDMKDMAYLFVFKLYDQLTQEGVLK